LSSEEWESLRSQIATLKTGRGQHRKFLPYVFTEHGALMAANVLNSKRAIEMSIFLVRTFIAMREALADTREFARRLDDLEKHLDSRLAKQDRSIAEIFAAIRALMNPPGPPRRPIGFVGP
jgi:phage regulator Rha-like protein